MLEEAEPSDLLQRLGTRHAALIAAAQKACSMWESTENHSLHEIRSAMRALRAVVGAGEKTIAACGLHLVTDAEKAVLDACSKFPTEALRADLDAQPLATLELCRRKANASFEWAVAELARRGEKA